MTTTNAIFAKGIVAARNGNDGDPHESISYDVLILEPESVAGSLPNIQPMRGFDPGMKIHPGNVGDPCDIFLFGGQAKVGIKEWVKFSPCGAGAAPATGGMLQTVRNLLERATGGGAAVSPGGGSEG